MNQYEVPALIAEKLPEVRDEIIDRVASGNVNNMIDVLTWYTQKMCTAHELLKIQNCMKLADRIYTKGNEVVKKAVLNVFVYSFPAFRSACNKVEWNFLQARMPVTLYSLYVQEVLKHNHTTLKPQ